MVSSPHIEFFFGTDKESVKVLVLVGTCSAPKMQQLLY